MATTYSPGIWGTQIKRGWPRADGTVARDLLQVTNDDRGLSLAPAGNVIVVVGQEHSDGTRVTGWHKTGHVVLEPVEARELGEMFIDLARKGEHPRSCPECHTSLTPFEGERICGNCAWTTKTKPGDADVLLVTVETFEGERDVREVLRSELEGAQAALAAHLVEPDNMIEFVQHEGEEKVRIILIEKEQRVEGSK